MSGIGLVMSGGGARGAYEVGVLSYVFGDLVRQRKRVPPLAIVAGTSVGAVNGTFVASVAHDLEGGVARLERMWRELELTDILRFGLRQIASLPRVMLGGAEASGVFDTAALRGLVTRELDFSRLRQNLDRGVLQAVTVTATHVMTGRPVVFVDRAPGTAHATALSSQALLREGPIRVEHVLASAAIPLIFPPIDIDGYLHCDGGLRLNTPMAPALHLGAERLLVIGVSSPSSAGAPALAPGMYPGASFLLGKVLNAFLLDHVNLDLANLERTNEFLRHGVEAFGEEFLSRMNAVAARDGLPTRRIVDVCAIHPSLDLGRLAAEHLRTHRLRFGTTLGRSFLQFLDVGEGADADLASYLLFDGAFAQRLIELGRRDARAKKDELEAFLYKGH